MSEIDELCYWDFAGITEYQSKSNSKSSGKSSYGKSSKTQQRMIQERKDNEAKRK